jgi:hypothetical protein
VHILSLIPRRARWPLAILAIGISASILVGVFVIPSRSTYVTNHPSHANLSAAYQYWEPVPIVGVKDGRCVPRPGTQIDHALPTTVSHYRLWAAEVLFVLVLPKGAENCQFTLKVISLVDGRSHPVLGSSKYDTVNSYLPGVGSSPREDFNTKLPPGRYQFMIAGRPTRAFLWVPPPQQ